MLANHGDIFSDIGLATAGLIFLGTPHRGSDAASYGVWLAQAAGKHTALLEPLRKNSPDLHEIARDFEASYSNADIFYFYENKDALYEPLRAQVS